MAKNQADTPVTKAERKELAYDANIQIQGLSDALLDLVRSQRVDSFASVHHAALGMLAQIRELSDDIFMLMHGDPDDEILRGDVRAIKRRLGR